ncbi:MAG: arsenate reductase (glutaredoxin) [Rhizobiales bacterium]|nr:arsenate reductase (glutaredoxin) [Hyphomicrobiales bacterium]MBN8985226.1 arsenate reductase (glutaredoxin) [Hyphomicrobiales bacterium]
MTERDVTIYHNPKCSNSRGALELIRAAGITPTVIEYLETPPSRAELADLLRRAGLTPREAIRTKETLYRELNLAAADDDAMLDAMIAHPVLIERPLVVTAKGVRLCRPPERVLDLF